MSYTVSQYMKGFPVTKAIAANAAMTVAFINDVLNKIPNVRITSTVRDAKHNAAVGGVANSKHLNTRALAVDFGWIADKAVRDKIKQIATAHGFGYLEHNVTTGMHIHCEKKT